MAAEKPCCKDETSEKELVKATQLPLHGNPYPPKDVSEPDHTSYLETKVRAVRVAAQPVTEPVMSLLTRANDIISVGAAHTQSTLERLSHKENTFTNNMVIAGSGLFALLLTRRRGFFTKLIVTSTVVGGSAAYYYPQEAQQKGQLAWLITKNKLPELVRSQYQKLLASSTKSVETPKSDSA